MAMLSDKKIRSAMKQQAKARALKRRELKAFLRGEGRNWPNVLVGEKFQHHPDWVGRLRRKWKLEIKDPNQALVFPEVPDP